MSEEWKITNERYICFLDIMGFKDLVSRNPHDDVLRKMHLVLESVKKWESSANKINSSESPVVRFPNCEIKAVTFSDSILIITKSSNIEELVNLIFVIKLLFTDCIKNSIPIKGAISKGLMTADFNKNLFFGKPLIHAYELQEELQYYGVVADRYVEKDCEFESNYIPNNYRNIVLRTKTPLKSGRTSCVNVSLYDGDLVAKDLTQLYCRWKTSYLC